MESNDERALILRMLEDGKISAGQAAQLLAALGDQADGEEYAGHGVDIFDPPRNTGDAGFKPEFGRWKWIWAPVAGAGAILVLLTLPALAGGLGSLVLLVCLQIPLVLLGALLLAVGLTMRKSPWVHVRVDTGSSEWPRKIAISVPLPLSLAAWFLRTFGGMIPQLKDYAVDDLLIALDGVVKSGEPMVIDVDEGNGEKVQVYIG